MKIVVIGGTGLIGSKVVSMLTQRGHEAIAASPSMGVNAFTGHGLAEALAGAEVVVDLANSSSFEDRAAMEFFQTSGRNIVAAEVAAGVRHHVALSVVGTDRLQDSGYFRAKLVQESIVKDSPVPYTLIRATQFFEFISAIAQSGTQGDTVRLPHALFQPIAAHDVAVAVIAAALAKPMNRAVEIAGPEAFPMDELVGRFLRYEKDARIVIHDPEARYFGLKVDDASLVPGPDPRLGETSFEWWLVFLRVPEGGRSPQNLSSN
jgi:uncharacterized protein YbjT (DUF2867 family)